MVYIVNELGQGELVNRDLSTGGGAAGVEITQLDATIAHLAEVYQELKPIPVRKPWLPPLPLHLISPCVQKYVSNINREEQSQPLDLKIKIGIVDIPEEQSQEFYEIDLMKDGNVAFFAAPGFGKTMFLTTVLICLALKNSVEMLHFYVCDFGNSGLIPLYGIPHTADYITMDDTERLGKLVRILGEEISRRKKLFARKMVQNFEVYNQSAGEPLKAMAALLPHEQLSAEQHGDIIKVLADGQSTDSNYRDKVLKTANPNSIAVKYNDIIAAKRAERSAMVKGQEVVYIYHDTIDEASHTADTMVFSACDDAIVELKNLVRIIVNDFGATNIILTSDHGFLYTYSPLKEDDKLDKSGFINRIVEYGRRFAIMMKGENPEYLQKVKFLDDATEYDAFSPMGNVRIKMNGGGLNFVHGGISLQEMVVPVIEYHYLRNNSREYQRNKHKYDTKPVELGLLSATHKVSNMIFSLNFYQKEPVGDNREAATYQLYFTDSSGKQISDIQKIIADKTSDNGQERTFRCSFNLKSLKYDSKEIYYLVIADENGLVVSREEFQIDIAFAVDEFDFFG